MPEYIDREKLKEFPIRRNHYDEINGNAHFINGIETVFEYADSLPAEDVVPVVHATWNKVYSNKAASVYECSNCKQLTFGTSDYCICGAKIDLKENE